MEQLVYKSVMFAVGTRCGFDLSVQEQDFSQIVNIKDEEIIYRLGSIVCDGYHEWKLCPNTFPLQVMGCRRKGTYIICF